MKNKKSSSGTAKRNREKSRTEQTAIILLKSLAFGLVCMVVIMSIAAIISCSADISKRIIPIVALFAAAVSAFAGGLYAAKKFGRKGLISGLLSQIPLFLVVMAATSILNRSLSLWIFVPLAVMLFCGALGGLTAVNVKRR